MMKYYHGKRLKPSEDDAADGSLGTLLVFACFCVESNSLFVSTNLYIIKLILILSVVSDYV